MRPCIYVRICLEFALNPPPVDVFDRFEKVQAISL